MALAIDHHHEHGQHDVVYQHDLASLWHDIPGV